MDSAPVSKKAISVKANGESGNFINGRDLYGVNIEKRLPEANEVLIEIIYCSVSNSKFNQLENEWNNTSDTYIPGDEIIGRVVVKGSNVLNIKVDGIVGVVNYKSIVKNNEQFSAVPVGLCMTYDGYFEKNAGDFNELGGLSTHIIVHKNLILHIPASMDISTAAAVLSFGVSTYKPLKKWGVANGSKVGVIGTGKVGHMGVKMAKAMGANVTAITTKEEKRADVIKLGADEVLISSDEEAMLHQEISFDFLLCTIPVSFNLNTFVKLLNPQGVLVKVGLLENYKKTIVNIEVPNYTRTIGESVTPFVAESQEVINFCARHNSLAWA